MAPRKSLSNVVVTYNSVNITQYLKQTDLEATVERLETTNLASTGAESIADSTTWTLGFNGMWDTALDTALAPDVITPGTKRTASIAITGSTQTVTYTWTTNAEIENYKISAAVGDFIGHDTALALSGAPTRGVA